LKLAAVFLFVIH